VAETGCDDTLCLTCAPLLALGICISAFLRFEAFVAMVFIPRVLPLIVLLGIVECIVIPDPTITAPAVLRRGATSTWGWYSTLTSLSDGEVEPSCACLFHPLDWKVILCL
jgi:hypothetical protein